MAKAHNAQRLRSHLRKSAGVSILLIVAASCGLSILVASRAFSNEAKAHEQAQVELLAQLTAPSLSVSDSGETQRLIKLLTSESNTLPAVITAAGDVLMGDYSSYPLVAQLRLKSGRWPTTCEGLVSEVTARSSYFVQCAPILGSSAGSADKTRLGIAVFLVPKLALKIPPNLALQLVAVFIALGVFPWLIFNHSVRTRVLTPIESLSDAVKATSTSPLDSNDLRIQGEPSRWPQELKLLSREFNQLLRSMQAQHQQLQSIQKQEAQFILAKQVAHDIRSPLSALKVAAGMLGEREFDSQQLLLSACDRIQGMADDLLNRSRSRGNADMIESVDAEALLNELLSEKRLEYMDRTHQFKLEAEIGYPALISAGRAGVSDLKRALSNLINNAVEANTLRGNQEVTVELASGTDELEIRIRDRGPGFPDAALRNIGKLGMSVGKVGGNGLGLTGAVTVVRSLGGDLTVESSHLGSSVNIRLPTSVQARTTSIRMSRQSETASL